MLSVKLKGKQPLRGICYPAWNGKNCNFLKCLFFSKITVFLFFSPCNQGGGERNPFSALFVVQSAFCTQKHRQFLPKPCFNLITMRFADTMNI